MAVVSRHSNEQIRKCLTLNTRGLVPARGNPHDSVEQSEVSTQLDCVLVEQEMNLEQIESPMTIA